MLDKKWLYIFIAVLLLVISRSFFLRITSRKSWASKINVCLKHQIQEMGCEYRSNMCKVYQDGTIGIDISNQNISDISALYLMPLSALNLENTEVRDLSPLSQCKLLNKLNINDTPVLDLSPLSNLNIEELFVNQTTISTLASLKNMKLKTLSICNTPISDISTIDSSVLEKLYLNGSDVTNLVSLIPENLLFFTFSENKITQHENGLDVIKNMTNCTINSYSKYDQFWKEYAARQLERQGVGSKYSSQGEISE